MALYAETHVKSAVVVGTGMVDASCIPNQPVFDGFAPNGADNTTIVEKAS